MRNSRIILAKNIKLDRNYNNVLNYTEEQMVELCTNNKVAEANDFSFIRTTRNIKTPFSYAQCLESNYIAFQNPDYSNKWFFAWIDDVIYKSDGCGEISFTIDAWSTWFSKLNIGQCFVIREHVSDDIAGHYTQPEGLELGDYFVNSHSRDIYNDKLDIVASSSISFNNDNPSYVRKYTGIPTGLTYKRWDINDLARRCKCCF